MSREVHEREGGPSYPPNSEKTKQPSTLLSLSGENLAIANSDIFFENHRLLLKIKENRECPNGPKVFKPLVRFPLFGKMPFDVRFMIFTQAAIDAEPRVIEIFYVPKGKFNQFPSKTLVPALMHVNSESRAAGSLIYKKLPTFGDARSFKDTFVNWEKDAFMIRCEEHVSALTDAVDTDSCIIKEGALNLAIMDSRHRDSYDISHYLNKGLQNVKSLYLVRYISEPTKNKSGPLTLRRLPESERDSTHNTARDMVRLSNALTEIIPCHAIRDTKFILKKGKAKQETGETDEWRKERLYMEDLLLAAKLSYEDSATRGTKNVQSHVEADKYEEWDGFDDDLGELEDFMSED